MRDTSLLKGIAGAFLGALGGFILFSLLGGSVPAFPNLLKARAIYPLTTWAITIIGGLGVGVVGVLSGGCPFRMHVLAAEGKKTYWFYLLGFYGGLIFYNLVTNSLLDAIRALN
jgi:uncharacterized membrane protein YedE/YeeE